jgi:hypothetical protein
MWMPSTAVYGSSPALEFDRTARKHDADEIARLTALSTQFAEAEDAGMNSALALILDVDVSEVDRLTGGPNHNPF